MTENIAIVTFNNGNGALLCNSCEEIIEEGFDHDMYVEHYCTKCSKEYLYGGSVGGSMESSNGN